MTSVRAILIDPFAATITETLCDHADIQDIYRLLSHPTMPVSTFESVQTPIFKGKDLLFVDEEGLLKPCPAGFTIDGWPQLIHGKGLILGADAMGATRSAQSSIALVRQSVQFYALGEAAVPIPERPFVSTGLKAFVEHVARRCEKIFRMRGEVLPFFHIIDGHGHDVLVPRPPGDKDVVMALIRAVLELASAKRVANISEAWMLDIDKSKPAPEISDQSLEHVEGRIEVLMISAEDQTEGNTMARCPIIRETGRRPRLGPLEFISFDATEGRMVGLLPRTGIMH